MDDLIVGALHECGVNGSKRFHPLHGQTSRKGHRVLLRDAHVKGALGESTAEFVDAGAARHGCRDRHHLHNRKANSHIQYTAYNIKIRYGNVVSGSE